MPFLDAFLCTLAAVLWGVNYIAIKMGVTAFHPLFAMFLRFVIVTVVLLPWISKTPRHLWKPLFKLSVIMGTLYFSFFFLGAYGVPAGEASIVVQLQVPIAALISAYVFKERLTAKVCLGIIIAMVGVIITIGVPDRLAIRPIIYLMVASFFWAAGNIYAKKLGDMNPLILNGTMALFAMPQLLVLSLIFEPHAALSLWQANLNDYVALFYMAIISNIVCYSIWFKMLQRHPVNKVMPFGLLVPIVAVIAADIITGEKITLHVLIGCSLCVSGLALILIKQKISKLKLPIEE
jgi:O-acetylserine/cysteine efflux transporter